jgi:NAD(P)-dependent dehydrogenase (short-subunit alcohol dehydrogenase family)
MGHPFDMSGMTVVVTGAASGIGAATLGLARSLGADVVGLDRNQSPDGTCIHVDLADLESIDAAIKSLPAEVHALCNVAGVPGTAPAETVMSINFLGLRHLTESLTERMPPGSCVVNVASSAGSRWAEVMDPISELLATKSLTEGLDWYRRAAPEMPVYNFTKSALLVYSSRSAWAWRDRGIRVNCVSPGPIETPILPDFRLSMGAELLDGVTAMVGRNGRPEEIASIVCFLGGTGSGWINGANIVADGGFLSAVSAGAITFDLTTSSS